MAPMPKQFVLPDLLAMCPLAGATNPHYRAAGAESSAWINSYNIFTDRKRAYFVQGCNELLVAHTYPYAGYEQFRTCCDFVNVLFVVDEVSDDQNGVDARSTGEVFLNVMNDPRWDDGSKLAQITREFRARYMSRAGPIAARRFLRHCRSYISGVSREAELRERGEVLDLDSFVPLRRENSAVRLCFDLFEYCLGINIPDEVFNNEVFREAYWAACDIVCWSNDLYSYNVEQAKGHSGNNVVTVLMKDRNIDLQSACDYVGRHCDILMKRYLSAISRLPSWGPKLDADISAYLESAGHWIKGNLDWSFETQRYFGPEHLQVKKTRTIRLRSPGAPEDYAQSAN